MKKKTRKKRLKRVTLLLTEQEKEVLEEYAARGDQSVTAAVRSILSASVEGFRPKTVLR